MAVGLEELMTAAVEMGVVARNQTRAAGRMKSRSIDWTSGLPILREAGVTLRELPASDAPSLLRLLGDEQVVRFLAPAPNTQHGFERFIAWTHRQRASGRFICFGVVPDGERSAIGMFQIWRVGSTFETAEIGFVFGAPFWGTGVFMESAPAFLTFAFETLCVVLLLAPRIGTRAHRAQLSHDLEAHVAKHAGRRVRVIVHGERTVIEALAARHGLQVARLLDEAGVIEANGAEIEALQQDSEIDHLSGDLPVFAGMSVTNVATGANQVWTGVSGLPGVTGKGVGVAVIDSGIKTHTPPHKKNVGNVSFWGERATEWGGGGPRNPRIHRGHR